MTLNSIFAGAVGIGIIGAVGYGIYKGLKGDKPSKARLAMRARTTPSKTSAPVAKATVPTSVVETSAPTPASVVETPTPVTEASIPTPTPVAETQAPTPTPAPVVETSAPTPASQEFISYSVKEAIDNNKTRVSIKDLRAEAREDLFEKYDGEIYAEDLQWFNAAVEEKVQEFVKEAEDAGLRVLR